MSESINKYHECAPIVYIIVFAIASNLFIPTSLLIITGGLLFGSINGLIYSLLGGTLSILLGYLIFNHLSITISKYMVGKIGMLFNHIQDRGILAILTIRLMAIPFTAQNFMASLLNTTFKSYFVGSVIGMTPWIICFSFFGESILEMKYQVIIISGLLLIVLWTIAFKLTDIKQLEERRKL